MACLADWQLTPARAPATATTGVRECAELLNRAINEPGAYRHSALRCDDRVALLEWSANCAGMQVADGVDAFLVEDGLIHVQTIR